jgi:hypothetical protein
MKYCFNLKFQLIYGIVAFLLVFGILYLFTKQINFITPIIVGVVEFVVAGYYTKSKC